MTLYDYQEAPMPHLQAILQDPAKRLCLINASTGYGKTFMALELVRRCNLSCSILCPKVTLGQWKRSADVVGVAPRFIINPEKLRAGRQKHLLEKRSSSSWDWIDLQPDEVVILDEFHRFGGFDSQLAFMAGNLSRYPVKMLALTATLADSPLKTRLLLHQARLVAWKDFFTWAKSIGCYRDPGINGHPWRPPFPKACRQVMADLNAKLFPAFGIRLRSEDVPNFPEVLNVVDLITPDEKTRREIQATYGLMADVLKDPNRAKTELTQLLRWRQRIEWEKLAVFRELVEDGLEDGYSVVVSFNFRESLLEFKRMFSARQPATVMGVSGTREQKERDDDIARFQSNQTRLMLLTIEAGGVGLDLPDLDGEHPRLAFHNLPVKTIELVQLIGRIHRSNSKSKSVNRIVLIDGVEIEKRVFAILNRKIRNLSALQNDELDLEKLIGT